MSGKCSGGKCASEYIFFTFFTHLAYKVHVELLPLMIDNLSKPGINVNEPACT